MPSCYEKTYSGTSGPGAGRRGGLVGESPGEPHTASSQLPSLAEPLLGKPRGGEGNPQPGAWISSSGWNGLRQHRTREAAVLI